MGTKKHSSGGVSVFIFSVSVLIFFLSAVSRSAPYLRVDTDAGVGVATYGGVYLEGQTDNTAAATAVLAPLGQDTGIITTQNYLIGLPTAQAIAQADYGVLRSWAKAGGCEPTRVDVGGTMTTLIANGTAYATAEFYDSLVISSPDAGGTGTVFFNVHVEGNMLGTILHPGVVSGAGWVVKFNGGTIADQWDYSANAGKTGGDFVVSVPFVFGKIFDFSFSLTAAANGYYCNTLSMADYFNSAVVTGLTVKDSNGSTLDNFTAVSASGHNYIPEPTAMCLFAFGLFVLRRQRS